MAEYLVCYDYGTGGIWLYLEAASAAEIAKKHPALTVFEAPPKWWAEEMEKGVRGQDATSPFWRDWLAKLEP